MSRSHLVRWVAAVALVGNAVVALAVFDASTVPTDDRLRVALGALLVEAAGLGLAFGLRRRIHPTGQVGRTPDGKLAVLGSLIGIALARLTGGWHFEALLLAFVTGGLLGIFVTSPKLREQW